MFQCYMVKSDGLGRERSLVTEELYTLGRREWVRMDTNSKTTKKKTGLERNVEYCTALRTLEDEHNKR